LARQQCTIEQIPSESSAFWFSLDRLNELAIRKPLQVDKNSRGHFVQRLLIFFLMFDIFWSG
jgi:hypothetical protein